MTDLRRILDDDPDLTMRALLDAARDDAPPDDAARKRTLLALGVGATTGAALTAGAVKLGASPGGPLAKVMSPLVLKWLVPLALSAGLGLGAVGYLHHQHARAARSNLASQQVDVVAPAQTLAASPQARGAVAVSSVPSTPAEPVEPVVSASTSVAVVVPPSVSKEPSTSGATSLSPSPPSSPSSPSPSMTETPTQSAPASAAPPSSTASPPKGAAASEPADRGELAAEVQRLDQAEAALAQHRPRVALARLADYQRDFPRGTLAPEATLLRIDALLLAGERPAAEQLAASFVGSRPGAAYAERVRALFAR